MTLQPITDVDEYRAVLNVVVAAEKEGNDLLARPLRALIDASPFAGCWCNGHARRPHEPACATCGGEGFVPMATTEPAGLELRVARGAEVVTGSVAISEAFTLTEVVDAMLGAAYPMTVQATAGKRGVPL